ncbi:MAG: PHP domain-containing protein [Planctomycetota bacterium]
MTARSLLFQLVLLLLLVMLPPVVGFSFTAIFTDFALAAAAAGPDGSALFVVAVALFSLVLGCWCRGIVCASRRVVLSLALGLPIAVGLIYGSCFLDGRTIDLGPEASGFVRASLHTQTNHSTGLLSPKALTEWHFKRGFGVLNVTDRDISKAAEEAQRRARGFHPPLLVLRGEEWHGGPGDVVLVNVRRDWDPAAELEDVLEGVRAEGGAHFVAHPWSKTGGKVDELLARGLDGAEIVNRRIWGGQALIRKAQRAEVAMLGVDDYKYGPHVTALTLIPADLARTPRGVVEAIRSRRTRILYAVPGGAITGTEYEASYGTAGIALGLRTLLAVPRGRRVGWFLWLALVAILWWGATRFDKNRMPRGTARMIFLVGSLAEFALLFGLQWQVRAAFGPIPVVAILCLASVIAVPLLAAVHALAQAQTMREEIAATAAPQPEVEAGVEP